MKQIIIVVYAMIFFISCDKENEMKNNKTVQNTTSPVKTLAIKDTTNTPVSNFYPCEYYPPTDPRSCNFTGGVTDEPITNNPIVTTATLYNGMLSFATVNDFISTMEQLDEADENYTGYDAYMTLFNGNLDKIDSFLDARKIDESSTFVNFENRFTGYQSWRKQVETDENNFLNNGGDPSSDLNPENLNIFADDVFRTVINKEGAVKIENIIFKFFDNGVCYAIKNGDMSLYNRLSHPENYTSSSAYYPEFYGSHFFSYDTTNVKLLTPYLLCSAGGEALPGDELVYPCLSNLADRQLGPNCKLWYHKKVEVKYDNDKRKYVSKIAVYNAYVYDVGLSKIRNYKLKSNGKWKPTRAKLSAYVYEGGCSDYNKTKNTKFRKFRRSAKRDMATIAPFIGHIWQGIGWVALNFLAKDTGYYRYFKTASNNGGFYGNNYCNGTQQLVKAQW